LRDKLIARRESPPVNLESKLQGGITKKSTKKKQSRNPVEAGMAPQIKGTLRRWREMLHWAMSRPQWPRQII
jgi:hypothetical protein